MLNAKPSTIMRDASNTKMSQMYRKQPQNPSALNGNGDDMVSEFGGN